MGRTSCSPKNVGKIAMNCKKIIFIPHKILQQELFFNLYLCVMGYKYIKLTSEEVLTLEQAVKNHSKSHFRTRCESVLLSNRGYDIKSIALLYQIRINTIGTWFSNWTNKGIVGLQIVSGRGRKADLSTACDALIQDIKEHIALNPQGLEAVCLQINEKWGLNLSKQQVKKFIKKNLVTGGDASENASKSVKTQKNTNP